MGFFETNIVSLEETRRLLADAMAHHGAGNLADAERLYMAVLDREYRIAEILPLVAGVASARGDLHAALEHWTRFLRIQPSHLFGLREKAFRAAPFGMG